MEFTSNIFDEKAICGMGKVPTDCRETVAFLYLFLDCYFYFTIALAQILDDPKPQTNSLLLRKLRKSAFFL